MLDTRPSCAANARDGAWYTGIARKANHRSQHRCVYMYCTARMRGASLTALAYGTILVLVATSANLMQKSTAHAVCRSLRTPHDADHQNCTACFVSPALLLLAPRSCPRWKVTVSNRSLRLADFKTRHSAHPGQTLSLRQSFGTLQFHALSPQRDNIADTNANTAKLMDGGDMLVCHASCECCLRCAAVWNFIGDCIMYSTVSAWPVTSAMQIGGVPILWVVH